MNLYEFSIGLLKQHQVPGGSFPASPAFSAYQYCWLRDGTFTAYALDVAGEREAAAGYYRWVHKTIIRHLHKFYTLLARRQRGLPLSAELFWHCRYTTDSWEGSEPWGHFQLDGYGAYLWGVAEHVKRRADGDEFLTEIQESLEATVSYLLEFWQEPNFDCWEENGDRVHLSTLAAVYGGLQRISELLPDPRIAPACAEIRAFVERHGVANGRFIKSLGNPAVDASLLWLTVPFDLFAADDARMVRTVAAIEADLCTGGVHRYPSDVFYGGGAWPLLTAWLGWYYLQAGQRERAQELLDWVEAQADERGCLPEQVPEGLLFPEERKRWVDQWGEPARPLLWAHAMYVVLKKEMMRN
ncbi:glycosyl hydrolase family 15 [Tumebacillus sp. BK434]|uniref:glycoside hydrolase family 15 protein n=1 Tax=Tumebacillus sp. BK434 TaxID=2512169 RepID=UPI0010509914|nr:glycoside hydrolase family 15 protein [Tumebacillus sp. BK434]TCP52640.1 glycosyl hydrolase family 15 [Tumebacillus sp. BK434]